MCSGLFRAGGGARMRLGASVRENGLSIDFAPRCNWDPQTVGCRNSNILHGRMEKGAEGGRRMMDRDVVLSLFSGDAGWRGGCGVR